jgi:sporulation protein YlmC with PRC-barrel domain
MTRSIVALAAASTLTLSMALAQTATSPPAPSPPGITQDINKDMNKSDTGKSDKAMTGASKIVNAQKPDEWLATKFRGTEVLGPDGVKVGSVDDILFDREGHIKALVVGVGGFLGIGAKEVALGFKEFQIVPGKEGSADQLKLAMTKDELTAAPEFKRHEPPRPAVTTAPGPGTGGAARRPMAPQ